VHVFIAGADETVALKTESLRRNTRYGKLDPVAPATVVAKTDALRRNTQHGKAKPASLTPEQTPSGGAAVFNEVAPALETEEAIEVEVKRSGPKTLMPQIKAHLIERSRKAECKQPWTVESVHLHTWAKNKFAVEIRTKQTKLPAIKRLREVLADTYYKSNPAFDRLQRFKQESTQAKTQAKSQAKR